MPKIVETRPIPDHIPIVSCPSCARHTAHTMPLEGSYGCGVCGTVHTLAPMRKLHGDLEPIWCATCRQAEGSNFWAAVAGRRQCRTCGSWVEVKVQD